MVTIDFLKIAGAIFITKKSRLNLYKILCVFTIVNSGHFQLEFLNKLQRDSALKIFIPPLTSKKDTSNLVVDSYVF